MPYSVATRKKSSSLARWTCSAVAIGLLLVSTAERGWTEEPADKLPLNKVVMFNSGVAFFEHGGEVKGDAEIELQFNVKDINDLLKSLVVQDLGGGSVSTVNYASKNPITKTLRTFAIDLTANPTLADLLNQVRGEKVQVDAPNAIEGVILGVERRKQQVGDDKAVEVDMLNLLTEEGLRSVPLASVVRIRLLNETLNAELRQALAILATSHSTESKSVQLHFRGEGERPVRLGYIQDAPIWKTSYRLVLKDDTKPTLQGWAIVENTTEQDWKNVDLTLVSGRPISFVMDLYEPLYVPRPEVALELFASLRPQTYNQDLAAADADFRRKADGKAEERDASEANRYFAGPPAAKRNSGLALQEQAKQAASGKSFDPSQGVQSLAQAADVGELFQYHIETPVDLPRQRSAMLPIVNGNVEAEKVSIYNANVQAKHPLNGFYLTNSTGLHLMQGPITVFDGGVYAGDAQIQDLQPNTKRLVSYALDLDTEVSPQRTVNNSTLVSVRIVKGTLYASYKHRRSMEYTIKNSGNRAKKVLIEQPVDATWKLIEPSEATEKTRDLYRFAVEAPPGVPVKLVVTEEYVAAQSIALSNASESSILVYERGPTVSEKIKEALREVIRRKQEISQVATDRQALEAQISVIDQEQTRIRQNMVQLDRNTDLYNRYVKKFGDQEDLIEGMRTKIRALAEKEAALRKALDAYLIELTIES